ncbi:HTH-type transcriptional regulator CdhR [Pseudoruegeria aquimaris]|uniref:HTH-type transcriptional regulator CdhR n=1 Tax=Pseudoruegeria aquimaris TaxID=393663 RepID=A0A1Y5SHF6_9RHOB|nr:GlxA family transcriptional regulator [Pseudoruegeria aquimaris]SLN40199.1 HTH-type transcriptional regulator CdhR [Pseudoruegeria aquimaris]
MQKWTKSPAAPQQVSLLLFDDFSNHCLANALEPLRAANTILGRPVYHWQFLTPTGEPVQSSSGLPILPHGALGACGPCDIFMVIASYNYRALSTPHTLTGLRRAARSAGLMAGLDTGGWIMAEAGLLEGREATVHWDALPEFEERFLGVSAQRAPHVFDGDRATCAGAMASFDFVLRLIEARHGTALSVDIESFFLRESRNLQLRHGPVSRDRLVAAALDRMRAELETPLPLPAIARQLGCHEKQLARRFEAALGASPGKVYRHIRLTAAKRIVEHTGIEIAEIAVRCGYENASALSRAFRLRYGCAPSAARRAARARSQPSRL